MGSLVVYKQSGRDPDLGMGAAGPLVLSWPEAGVSEGVRMRIEPS